MNMHSFNGGSLMKRAAVALLLLTSAAAQAAQWTGYFTITSTYVSGADNQHYRVYGMAPLPSVCPTAPSYAYINQNSSGAKTYIAALMSAQVAGKSVNLYVDNDSGYCRIIEMAVQTN
jgi:hypothetical protein